MEKKSISCCGVDCAACGYYPEECGGCAAIGGKPFWLEFTGEAVCAIYRCCVEEKGLAHCGLCPELPCQRFEGGDPTKSEEENRADFESQLRILKEMSEG